MQESWSSQVFERDGVNARATVTRQFHGPNCGTRVAAHRHNWQSWYSSPMQRLNCISNTSLRAALECRQVKLALRRANCRQIPAIAESRRHERVSAAMYRWFHVRSNVELSPKFDPESGSGDWRQRASAILRAYAVRLSEPNYTGYTRHRVIFFRS